MEVEKLRREYEIEVRWSPFLLDPSSYLYLSSGPLRNEYYEANYPIPMIPGLVGLTVFFQSVIFDSGKLLYINADCATIRKAD